jgi:hypothetical protein
MTLVDGNRFDIEGDNGEEITFVMTEGTFVDRVTTVLDGVEKQLGENEALTFIVNSGVPRRLTVVYLFQANSGGAYKTNVSGSGRGDESVDDFAQIDKQATMERVYTFNRA